MRSSLLIMAMSAATLVAAPALATADPYAALDAMRDLNVITLSNLNSSSQHVQGKVYVGGNLTGNLTAAANGSSSSGFTASSYAQLTVGGSAETWTVNGSLGASKIQVNIGGNSTGQATINGASSSTKANVKTGGTFNSSGFNADSNKTYTASAGTSFKNSIATTTSTLSTNLNALSADLKALQATNITNLSKPLTVASGADYAVFNISEALFESSNTNFDTLFSGVSSSTTIIINVAGTTITEGGGSNFNNANMNQNVIWNFADATSVTLSSGWHGSILATKATLTTSSSVEGSVVAKVFNMGGEVHLGTFNGTDAFLATDGGGTTPVGNVPEPASWMTMMMGFGIIGSVVRRRRRQERLAA